MPYRTFSVAEVADYLHLAVGDVEELVHHREIPCARQGGRLLFRKQEIDTWASQRILGFAHARLEHYHRQSSAAVQHATERDSAIVSELVHEGFVDAGLASRTKSGLIRDMAELAGKTGLVTDPPDLLASLLERESLCSTALAGGFALLHPRHHEAYMFADSFVVLAKVVHALPFGAPDGGQTDVFVLACCQDDRIPLHVLARLGLLCTRTELLTRVREAADAATMMAELRAAEAQVTSGAVGA